MEIKEVKDKCSASGLATVIASSFLTVAEEFGFTKENAPTNPAYITEEKILTAMENGIRFFGATEDGLPIGCVAIERSPDDGDCFYIERLAVLPGYRHSGYGKKLMNRAFEEISESGGKTAGIAIVNENTVLKKWYESLGFEETGTKKFDHLPFTVCFMKREVAFFHL